MHLGNVWVALLGDLAVHASGGEQILRIEDLDQARSAAPFVEQLIEDLDWLGLHPDRGAPPQPLIRQQDRTALYQEIFEILSAQGRVYPCYCRRADLLAASAPHLEDGHRVYSGACKPQPQTVADHQAAPASRQPAWRLTVPDERLDFQDLLAGPQSIQLAQEWGDFVIRRADHGFAYQLACAVDDAMMGVSLVVRGRDLLRSTFPQLHLFQLMVRPAPSYLHLPLLVDPDGYRLSKRQQSLDLGALRAAGFTAPQIIGYLAWLAGLTDRPERVTARELQAGFDPVSSLHHIQAKTTIPIDPAALYSLLA
jgi:glutamyl-tRNA synthetase